MEPRSRNASARDSAGGPGTQKPLLLAAGNGPGLRGLSADGIAIGAFPRGMGSFPDVPASLHRAVQQIFFDRSYL